jgi:Domain of unknown function (DUF1707)
VCRVTTLGRVTSPVPARDLRVSDDERHHVVSLLEKATGRGLIDLDEFTTRVDTALAARTRAELNAVLVDLPGLVHPEGRVHPSAPAHRPSARPATSGGTGPVLTAELGSVTRKGSWEVPAHLRVNIALGSADLDFTEAEIPHDVVEIDVNVTAGSVELRLPENARLERDEVHAVLGSIEEKRRGGDGSGPLFVLRGQVRAGSLEIKGPRKRLFGRRG